MADRDGDYKKRLVGLQIELVKLQRELIAKDTRVLVFIEGRDGAGKDGTIKVLTEHMSPRETRVYAPSKPSDAETRQWYFQRFVPHLPSGGEFTIFNRSWYNRAGVERVMGFCTEKQVEEFFDTVTDFESQLVRSGLRLHKYYLDISRAEQKRRLADRQKDPLKAWKNSPIDAKALKKWEAYTRARDEMFLRTSHGLATWRIVKSDNKKLARLGLMRDLLGGFTYPGRKESQLGPDNKTVFVWTPGLAKDEVLAR